MWATEIFKLLLIEYDLLHYSTQYINTMEHCLWNVSLLSLCIPTFLILYIYTYIKRWAAELTMFFSIVDPGKETHVTSGNDSSLTDCKETLEDELLIFRWGKFYLSIKKKYSRLLGYFSNLKRNYDFSSLKTKLELFLHFLCLFKFVTVLYSLSSLTLFFLYENWNITNSVLKTK